MLRHFGKIPARLKSLIVLIIIQLVFILSIALDIPIATQIFSFIFLVFFPGYIVLTILRIRELQLIDIILYSVGLSIAFVMLLGCLINFLYPLIGISEPLSTLSIVGTITIITIILSIFAYLRKKENLFSNSLSWSINFSEMTLAPTLFLLALPILSILGAYSVTFYGNNILLLFLLAILPIVPILVAFGRIPKNLFLLALFSVAISLLFSNSLISKYLVEWGDSSWEYYFANDALKNSLWNFTLHSNYNADLSTNILAPVLSKVCNIDLMWVFKILYPLIFAFSPLAIYRVTQKQTSEKIAFFSSFLFMATFTFFTSSLGTARFEVAALFLLLLLLAMVGMESSKSRTLLIAVFSFSLIVSHYALATMFLVIIFIALVLLLISRRKSTILNIGFVLFYATMAMAWFSFVSSQSVLQSLGNISSFVGGDILTRFLNPLQSNSLNIFIGANNVPLLQLTAIAYLIAGFFISFAVISALVQRRNRIFKREYFLLSIASFALLVVGLLFPHLALSLGIERLYHYSLLFLAPFCIIGGIAFFDLIINLIKHQKKISNRGSSKKMVSLFIAVYLLASTGLIFNIAGQPVTFSMLSLNSTSAWHAHFNDAEMTGAKWVDKNTNTNANILIDYNGAFLLQMLRGIFSPLYGDGEVKTPIVNGDYVFLDHENIVDGIARLGNQGGRGFGNSTMVPLLQNSTFWNDVHRCDKIYDAGDVQVFYCSTNKSP